MKIRKKQSITLTKFSTLINNKKVKELKYQLIKEYFKGYQQHLHKQKQVINLKTYEMITLIKLILCIEKRNLLKKHITIK